MVSVITGEGRLSQLLMDADLVMGAFNVTLGAGQTVDGKDVSALLKAGYILSDVLLDSDDAPIETITDNTYVTRKIFTFTSDYSSLTLRTKFKIARISGSSTMYGQICLNDVVKGTEQTCTGGYVEKSEDIALGAIVTGDELRLKCKYPDSALYGGVKEFRIYGTTKITN